MINILPILFHLFLSYFFCFVLVFFFLLFLVLLDLMTFQFSEGIQRSCFWFLTWLLHVSVPEDLIFACFPSLYALFLDSLIDSHGFIDEPATHSWAVLSVCPLRSFTWMLHVPHIEHIQPKPNSMTSWLFSFSTSSSGFPVSVQSVPSAQSHS